MQASASPRDPYLRIERLVKQFGAFTALRDVSLEIFPGEFVCFLGPSGCGKTTLLRAIAGLDIQTSGRIFQAGKDISTLPASKRDFGIVFQSYALFPNLSVAANVAYGLVSRGVPKVERQTRVVDLLRLVGMPEAARKYPAQLSGGQQQRVALARALALSPGLLLLDEPLSALDARVRAHLRSEIRELHQRLKVTTIMVTHDQEEALTMADRIVVMNQGVIEQAGSPEEIYQRPKTEFVARFIGGTNVFKGRWDGRDTVACTNGVTLRCESGDFSAQGDTAVSVRHHDIRLSTTGPEATQANWVRGTVARQIYLGSHRDYLVAIADGSTVHAVSPSEQSIAPGNLVWLHFPPERCRALAQ